MLNPSLSNFKILYSDAMFPKHLTEKYDNYLRHINSPIKSIRHNLEESFQQISTPGINLQTLVVQGLMNLGKNPRPPEAQLDKTFPPSTVNSIHPGTAPMNEIYDNPTFTITYRNNILNWMYLTEVLLEYYKRTRGMETFDLTLRMLDSAEVELYRLHFNYVFVSAVPGLEFSTISQFNETRTIDITFTFSKMDIDICIPDFKVDKVNLNI